MADRTGVEVNLTELFNIGKTTAKNGISYKLAYDGVGAFSLTILLGGETIFEMINTHTYIVSAMDDPYWDPVLTEADRLKVIRILNQQICSFKSRREQNLQRLLKDFRKE